MENTALDISEEDFVNGSPLHASLFKFGDTDLIKEYRKDWDRKNFEKKLSDNCIPSALVGQIMADC